MTEPAGVTVIVIPQPTVNGPLHIGHLSGPYLAADVASRAAKARGERVLTLAGIDVHPNYVLTKAENLGVDVDEMVADYRSRITTAYDLARIGYDVFLDPQDADYQRAIAGSLREMVTNGTVPMEEYTLDQCSDCGRTLHHSYVVGKCPVCGTGANGTSCEGCGGFTSAQLLIDPSCTRCGGSPQPLVATVPVLRLEDYRERLVAEWVQGEWPARMRSLLRQYQQAPLPDIPLAYPTNWGIECDGPLAGLRVDFPTELGLSYLYGPALALRPEAETLAERVEAWTEVDGVWHFNGMDNTFYFTILYPALLAAAGVPTAKARGAVVNELYLLEGQKFSTSRNHALWADEFLATEDPELVRMYLSWDRPDRYESDFTDASFRAFCDWVRPLLDGGSDGGPAIPVALAAAELDRAEQALHLAAFDSALATRSLLMALTTGKGIDSPAMAALAGRDAGRGPGTG
ncbi:MAG: class I tRNA ligase family protein [Actinomycetota bacterium]|nr:class I tRNA ligase family protein [Actinomycetota bacterium]